MRLLLNTRLEALRTIDEAYQAYKTRPLPLGLKLSTGRALNDSVLITAVSY